MSENVNSCFLWPMTLFPILSLNNGSNHKYNCIFFDNTSSLQLKNYPLQEWTTVEYTELPFFLHVDSFTISRTQSFGERVDRE